MFSIIPVADSGVQHIMLPKKAEVTNTSVAKSKSGGVFLGTRQRGTGIQNSLTVDFHEGFSIDVDATQEGFTDNFRDMVKVQGRYRGGDILYIDNKQVSPSMLIAHEDSSVKVKFGDRSDDLQHQFNIKISPVYEVYITDSGVLDAKKNLSVELDGASSALGNVGVHIDIHGDDNG